MLRKNTQDDGTLLKTSIPLHLDFAKKRRQENEIHFAQVVRLIKFWTAKEKRESATGEFRFKSFMIEMILSHLSDEGCDFSDYPEALQTFFTYLATSNMREKIIFPDYYDPNKAGSFSDPIQIVDPVNEENNVGRLYTDKNIELIVGAAIDAGDAIDSALAATTKEKTVYYWQKVFGSSFQG